MLYRLPMFKIAVVICSFNCLIALEAKCHPSNGGNFRPPFVGIMFSSEISKHGMRAGGSLPLSIIAA